MFKNLIQLYATAICFLAAIILMIASIFAIIHIIDMVFPEERSPRMYKYSSNEAYMDNADSEKAKEMKGWSQEKLTQRRFQDKQEHLDDFCRDAKKSLMDNIVWIVIAGFFFISHWYIYKKQIPFFKNHRD